HPERRNPLPACVGTGHRGWPAERPLPERMPAECHSARRRGGRGRRAGAGLAPWRDPSRGGRDMRVGLGFLLALAGGLLFSAGVIGYWRNAGATATPETISLHDLLARWPRGNPHVRITEFHLCNRFSKWGSNKRQEWRAYIPLVPAQPGVPAGA